MRVDGGGVHTNVRQNSEERHAETRQAHHCNPLLSTSRATLRTRSGRAWMGMRTFCQSGSCPSSPALGITWHGWIQRTHVTCDTAAVTVVSLQGGQPIATQRWHIRSMETTRCTYVAGVGGGWGGSRFQRDLRLHRDKSAAGQLGHGATSST